MSSRPRAARHHIIMAATLDDDGASTGLVAGGGEEYLCALHFRIGENRDINPASKNAGRKWPGREKWRNSIMARYGNQAARQRQAVLKLIQPGARLFKRQAACVDICHHPRATIAGATKRWRVAVMTTCSMMMAERIINGGVDGAKGRKVTRPRTSVGRGPLRWRRLSMCIVVMA